MGLFTPNLALKRIQGGVFFSNTCFFEKKRMHGCQMRNHVFLQNGVNIFNQTFETTR